MLELTQREEAGKEASDWRFRPQLRPGGPRVWGRAKHCRPIGASPARPLLLHRRLLQDSRPGAGSRGTTSLGRPSCQARPPHPAGAEPTELKSSGTPRKAARGSWRHSLLGIVVRVPLITLPHVFSIPRVSARGRTCWTRPESLMGKEFRIWWRFWEWRRTTCSDGLWERQDPEVRVCEASLEVVRVFAAGAPGREDRVPLPGESPPLAAGARSSSPFLS